MFLSQPAQYIHSLFMNEQEEGRIDCSLVVGSCLWVLTAACSSRPSYLVSFYFSYVVTGKLKSSLECSFNHS